MGFFVEPANAIFGYNGVLPDGRLAPLKWVYGMCENLAWVHKQMRYLTSAHPMQGWFTEGGYKDTYEGVTYFCHRGSATEYNFLFSIHPIAGDRNIEFRGYLDGTIVASIFRTSPSTFGDGDENEKVLWLCAPGISLTNGSHSLTLYCREYLSGEQAPTPWSVVVYYGGGGKSRWGNNFAGEDIKDTPSSS